MKQIKLPAISKSAMKKIKGTGGAVIAPACTAAGEVKCSRTIPCPKGCSCAGNRCAPDDLFAA